MISIAIYGTCQEMHLNGPQSTLLAPAIAISPLVLVEEGVTVQVMAEPTIARLSVTTAPRLSASATLVCVPYFM